MDKLQQEMSRLIDGFVAQMEVAARKAAMDVLGAVFDGNAHPPVTPARRRRAPRSGVAADSPPAPVSAHPAAGRADIEARVIAQLRAHPGCRMVHLLEALTAPPEQVKAAVKRLAKKGTIRFVGNTRGRTYFAVEGATATTSSSSRRRGQSRRRA